MSNTAWMDELRLEAGIASQSVKTESCLETLGLSQRQTLSEEVVAKAYHQRAPAASPTNNAVRCILICTLLPLPLSLYLFLFLFVSLISLSLYLSLSLPISASVCTFLYCVFITQLSKLTTAKNHLLRLIEWRKIAQRRQRERMYDVVLRVRDLLFLL